MAGARIVVSLLLCAALTACGLSAGGKVPGEVGPGSIRRVPALEGVPITVGSKDFTDDVNVGYIMVYALQAAGMDVTDLTNIQGSNSSRTALLNGQIDLYPEHTGTSWINYNGNTKPITDKKAQFRAVNRVDQKLGITWVAMAPSSNQYAMAVGPDVAEEHGFETLTDMAEFIEDNPDEATVCLETEFASRTDGWPGMAKKYGIDLPKSNITVMDTGAIYPATASGRSCMFGEVFTTDGRIPGLELTVLEDDRKFFPNYNVCASVRTEVLRAHPEIEDVLEPVMAKVTDEVMIQLNAKADVEGQDWSLVVRNWMAKEGLVTKLS